VKILIADDEAPARTRLRAWSKRSTGDIVNRRGEAANGREALAAQRQNTAGRAAAGIRMPAWNGTGRRRVCSPTGETRRR